VILLFADNVLLTGKTISVCRTTPILHPPEKNTGQLATLRLSARTIAQFSNDNFNVVYCAGIKNGQFVETPVKFIGL